MDGALARMRKMSIEFKIMIGNPQFKRLFEEQELVLFATAPIPTLGPTKCPIQWVPVIFSRR
jgi:hypothetical protein